MFLFAHATDALYGNVDNGGSGQSASLLLFSAEHLSGGPRSPVTNTNNAHQWYDSHLTKLFTTALTTPLVGDPAEVNRPCRGPPPLRPSPPGGSQAPDGEAVGSWPCGAKWGHCHASVCLLVYSEFFPPPPVLPTWLFRLVSPPLSYWLGSVMMTLRNIFYKIYCTFITPKLLFLIIFCV